MSSEQEASGQVFDVVIVGGGMVGASLAIALARLPLRIAIVEAVPPQTGIFQPSYDMRSTALSWGTRLIYEQLGIWSQLSPHLAPIQRIHVSDKGHLGVTRLKANDEGVDALGYVAPNALMGAVLWEQLRSLSSVTLYAPAKVAAVWRAEKNHIELMTETGSKELLQSHLLVVADGGRSDLCRQLGIDSTEVPYDQHAVIANVSFSRPHQFEAFERFTDTGPLAVLPLGTGAESGDCAVVWTTPETMLPASLSWTDAEFAAGLQERFGYRLGRVVKVGERASYPLRLVRANEQIRPGVVVVGNAAHSLHPVAGQGYNLALRGVMSLVETLELALQRNQKPGDYDVLDAFLTRQRDDQNKTIFFSDKITRLFSNKAQGLTLLRDAGLMGMDVLPFVKSQFARQAMGLGGKKSLLSV
ncbi:MAG: 2-octaprenyl-6-methoxyphenyl hydroxylase [Hahellaceae bacterium]|nr:2-octaprenyl-6-methoxyphenyl hydroxylase [Hahellaceae bacterium]MCP5168623.1 2-octaprenyl-6-methoxyphenyl hydroxylase [Hahellaceae bacterium]